MSLLAHGNNTLVVEITNISAYGVWILAYNQELFMSYKDFSWFKGQTVQSIINVVEESKDHFYWPDIDIDLTEEMIKFPECFPLIAKMT